ncbi:unnamed protein product [Sphagnum balticum]
MREIEEDLVMEKNPRPLDVDAVALLKSYVRMKESDTGLAVPSEWDLVSDKQMMQEEQPLQFVVGLRDKVSPMDIEEGMHVGPTKGNDCYGPPETGKTLLACAVANQTNACFIHVIGSKVVQKYVGEGAHMVLDAIGGARFDDGSGGGNEVQHTMLEIVNQLDGFDACGNIKVLMATNRLDMLDPALL